MVDNKVKTKTAMLQELESIKGLLLEDDDIPILQEVIDDHAAARDEANQPPLEQQDLDELHTQFKALSQTFASTDSTINPSITSMVSPSTSVNMLEAYSENLRQEAGQMGALFPTHHEPSPFNEPGWHNDLDLLLSESDTDTGADNSVDATPLIPAEPVQQALPIEMTATAEPRGVSEPPAQQDEMPVAGTGITTSAPNTNVKEPAADTHSGTARPALAKAAGENPFLPQHIRARLHGNNPPPLFDFSLSKSTASSAAKATGENGGSLRQSLIRAVINSVMPKVEEELRQRLEQMTQEELELLRDQH